MKKAGIISYRLNLFAAANLPLLINSVDKNKHSDITCRKLNNFYCTVSRSGYILSLWGALPELGGVLSVAGGV